MQKTGSKLWQWIEKFVYAVLGVLFKIAGKELSEDAFQSYMQLVYCFFNSTI